MTTERFVANKQTHKQTIKQAKPKTRELQPITSDYVKQLYKQQLHYQGSHVTLLPPLVGEKRCVTTLTKETNFFSTSHFT